MFDKPTQPIPVHAFLAIFAESSFFIHETRIIGPFSPIHILLVRMLLSLVQAIRHVRAKRIAEHARLMKVLYFHALIIAGVFTLVPGRIVYPVLFGT